MPNDAPAASFPCQARLEAGRLIMLRALLPFRAQGGIAAYLDGHELARLPLEGPVKPGQELELTLRRLPRAELPGAIRFATADGATEIAPPLALASGAAAAQLFGPGLWSAEEVRVELGVLRGLLRNDSNALAEPVAFARINGVATRPLLLGRPVVPNDGMAIWPFELPLKPEDLMEAGIALTVHVAGQVAPLASLAWGRAWAGEEAARLVAMEARMAELERVTEARLAQLQAERVQLVQAQQARLDAFLEAAGALLLDRATEGAEAGLAALRAVSAEADRRAAELSPPPREAPHLLLPLDSPAFRAGWHLPERDDKAAFRWMAASGVVDNPAPERLVGAVEVETVYLWRAEAPDVAARLDGTGLAVALLPAEPGRFRLRLTPPQPMLAERFLLDSRTSGSPAQDGVSADDRVLSLAVTSLVFEYATPA